MWCCVILWCGMNLRRWLHGVLLNIMWRHNVTTFAARLFTLWDPRWDSLNLKSSITWLATWDLSWTFTSNLLCHTPSRLTFLKPKEAWRWKSSPFYDAYCPTSITIRQLSMIIFNKFTCIEIQTNYKGYTNPNLQLHTPNSNPIYWKITILWQTSTSHGNGNSSAIISKDFGYHMSCACEHPFTHHWLCLKWVFVINMLAQLN